jgi:hypothetical protein
MKRLDQIHLRPKLEVTGRGHSIKEPFEPLGNSYSEHLQMSARPVENARDSRKVELWKIKRG